MTPLFRFFAHYLPSTLVWPAVTLTYAAALTAIFLLGKPVQIDIVYIDLEQAE